MKIVSVNEVMAKASSDAWLKTLFEDGKATMGTAVFPPGARVPKEGTGAHDADEYALILKGSILTMSGGTEYRLESGKASLIPQGEEHWSLNDSDEDCELVWFLVKK
ncbi:MAG: cupin domain-containing protein [Dehalobacterium sp.]